MTLLFQHKLSIPSAAYQLIERTAVLERLDQAITTKQVVALGALAGWGKTTVLAQWAAGATLPVQFTVAGVLGVALTLVAHRLRLAKATPPPQPSLDIGKTVRVEIWNADGTARVNYRGSTWDAELATPGVPRAATLYIVATRGSRLILSDRPPSD